MNFYSERTNIYIEIYCSLNWKCGTIGTKEWMKNEYRRLMSEHFGACSDCFCNDCTTHIVRSINCNAACIESMAKNRTWKWSKMFGKQNNAANMLAIHKFASLLPSIMTIISLSSWTFSLLYFLSLSLFLSHSLYRLHYISRWIYRIPISFAMNKSYLKSTNLKKFCRTAKFKGNSKGFFVWAFEMKYSLEPSLCELHNDTLCRRIDSK